MTTGGNWWRAWKIGGIGPAYAAHPVAHVILAVPPVRPLRDRRNEQGFLAHLNPGGAGLRHEASVDDPRRIGR
jgi:hypothetical protein